MEKVNTKRADDGNNGSVSNKQKENSFVINSNIDAAREVIWKALSYIKTHVPSISLDDLYDFWQTYNVLLVNAVVSVNEGIPTKKVEVIIDIDREDGVVVTRIMNEGETSGNSGFKGYDATGVYIEALEKILPTEQIINNFSFSAAGDTVSFRKRVSLG